jgi:outer membrane lipoprotein-sorting protein
MKKTHILLLISFSLLALSPAYTQEDGKAGQILSRLSEKSEALQPFRVTFDITSINLQDKTQETTGGELLLDGKKYVLKNGNSEIYFDGTTLWNYLPDVNEVNILLPDPEDNSFLARPQQLFSGYKDRFKFHYVGENSADGKKLWVVDLYPYNLQESYSRIRLQIDQATSLLHSARYFGKNGMHYLVVIRKIEHLKDISPATFSFDPARHPGVEVIDLRDNG